MSNIYIHSLTHSHTFVWTSQITSSGSCIACGTPWWQVKEKNKVPQSYLHPLNVNVPLVSATALSSLAARSQLFSPVFFFPVVEQKSLDHSWPPPLLSSELYPVWYQLLLSIHWKWKQTLATTNEQLAYTFFFCEYERSIILCTLRKSVCAVKWVTAVMSFLSLVLPATII